MKKNPMMNNKMIDLTKWGVKTISAKPASFDIALVVSSYHQDITSRLLENALTRLTELEFKSHQILVVEVPGAIEIPLMAQRLARTQQYKAIICLGAVIQGETSHFDYVCQQVSYGCQRVALTQDIPIIFGVLTTQTMEQAYERVEVGRQSVDTAYELVAVLNKI